MSIAAVHTSAFYREVAKSGFVWGIRDEAGFPAPLGSDGARAMPFWSSESRALKIIQNLPAYGGFTPVAIEWSIFCERWVPGLTQDGLLVGVNWSGQAASGYEIQPLSVQRNIEALRKST
ncbi:DUF2750 domain-containing protein [Pseudomonas sp. BMS12]|uniref:DUF2750 domain-containing protein n=1 Tax=Pseudomonas sp. BMS12 TaxID=1796033 RepID=UPI0009EE00A2|nr:DUF2750 domain-containing protein [Pseudomonas sp. BMS12]